ncbi:hypothetical protein PISMIDRAFT_115659, partial [Pisolithus microcarpus 441]
AFQLISTGTAEDVINIEIMLQDMKNKPMPSQLGYFHPWEAYLNVGVKQNLPLQVKGHDRVG